RGARRHHRRSALRRVQRPDRGSGGLVGTSVRRPPCNGAPARAPARGTLRGGVGGRRRRDRGRERIGSGAASQADATVPSERSGRVRLLRSGRERGGNGAPVLLPGHRGGRGRHRRGHVAGLERARRDAPQGARGAGDEARDGPRAAGDRPAGASATTVTDVHHVYEDRFGEIIDRPKLELVELRWYDSTVAMSGERFEGWLQTFAAWEEQLRRPRVLVDATRFMMDRAQMDDAWRDAHIIPRYNAAGVRRFAFLYPDGVPLIGTPPGPL